MPYLAYDLDALNKAPLVARAAQVDEDAVHGGLVRMWAYCFREKTDRLTAIQVRGFFSTPVDVVPALGAFSFLDGDGDELRVRGADRYLRIAKGRSKGGKAASGNLKRGGEKPDASRAQAGDSAPAASRLEPGCEPGASPGCFPALSPSTEHRTPNTRKEEEKDDPVAAFDIPPPPPDVESWDARDFWRWAELRRRAGGYAPEKWPDAKKLSGWWREARSVVRTVERLKATFYAFGQDEHWERARPAFPFKAFMSQWNQFLPKEAE